MLETENETLKVEVDRLRRERDQARQEAAEERQRPSCLGTAARLPSESIPAIVGMRNPTG